MLEGWVIQTIENFWTNVGEVESFPRSLETSIKFALPIAIEKIPQLRLEHIDKWSKQNRIPLSLSNRHSRVCGCLVAYRGKGWIFLDATDCLNEQRFSLAHEVAHFLLDYQQPRQKAISKFGNKIIEVLDGDRDITVDERISAILGDMTIGLYVNLIKKLQDGILTTEQGIEIENRADRLALELLAPMDEVQKIGEKDSQDEIYGIKVGFIKQKLLNHFGLLPLNYLLNSLNQ